MAQKQFTTYQADVLSFDLREALLGIIRPGRFSGFDQITDYDTPDGTIYLHLSHSAAAVQKLAKLGSSLDSPIGVAVTTQGTIIHEDATEIVMDIPDNNASQYDKWYIIYMEHDYVEVQGANNASYGFIAGTGGGGMPTLLEAYHRVPLAYIQADSYATEIAHLHFYPASAIDNLGDEIMGEVLFGHKWMHDDNRGTVPGGLGVIGDRNYSNNNYLTDYTSLTQSLSALDLALSQLADLETVDGTKPLDEWGTPGDNTDLDATIAEHGLLPKLSNDTDEFLRGDGAWAVPPAGFVFIGSAAAYHYNSSAQGGNITMGSQYELDISNEVPAGYNQVVIGVSMKCYWGAGNTNGRYGAVIFQKGGTTTDKYQMQGPHPFSSTALNDNPSFIYFSEQIICEISATRTIRITWAAQSGDITDWLNDIQIKIQAYR